MLAGGSDKTLTRPLTSARAGLRRYATSSQAAGHRPDLCTHLCTRRGGMAWREADVPRSPAPIRQAQRDDQRPRETPKMYVVRLITQRSRVQIPPPLLRCRSRALSEQGEGLLHVACKLICKRRVRRVCSGLTRPQSCRRLALMATVRSYSTL